MSVADNLARIREDIGHYPTRLVAVSKYASVKEMSQAFDCGVTEFGESRVADAIAKQDELKQSFGNKVSWHFVGHLQSNKANKVVGRFDLIHSVDSFALAEKVSQAAQNKGCVQKILLQVKLVDDPSKSGFSPDELRTILPQILELGGISVEGLMTMAPNTADATIWQKCFYGLKLFRDELSGAYNVELKELSMGMSDDYKMALECGSTMVRLGRAVFGT